MAVIGWLGATVLATGVTLAAVSSIGAGIFGSPAGPLDRQEVTEALATLSPPASPTRQGGPGPTEQPSGPSTQQPGTDATPVPPTAEPSVITTVGGTVVARCTTEGLVELLSWSPAQGFRVDNAERGPAREVEVEFESGDDDIEVKIRCVDGVPVDVENDDD